MVKKAIMFGKPLDEAKLKEELGDVMYYMAVLARAIGCDFEEIMAGNMAKLKARFPNGFTEADAITRRDMGERK